MDFTGYQYPSKYDSTINRWVITFAPMLEYKARQLKRKVLPSWRMDETYIKIKGEWWYYYLAVDKYGDIVDLRKSSISLST